MVLVVFLLCTKLDYVLNIDYLSCIKMALKYFSYKFTLLLTFPSWIFKRTCFITHLIYNIPLFLVTVTSFRTKFKLSPWFPMCSSSETHPDNSLIPFSTMFCPHLVLSNYRLLFPDVSSQDLFIPLPRPSSNRLSHGLLPHFFPSPPIWQLNQEVFYTSWPVYLFFFDLAIIACITCLMSHGLWL